MIFSATGKERNQFRTVFYNHMLAVGSNFLLEARLIFYFILLTYTYKRGPTCASWTVGLFKPNQLTTMYLRAWFALLLSIFLTSGGAAPSGLPPGLSLSSFLSLNLVTQINVFISLETLSDNIAT